MNKNKKRTIMIVDDDPDMLFTVDLFLKKEGYEIIKAGGGLDCLEKLEVMRPALILMDIMMPEMDGWDTLKEIREKDGFQSIPVVMLTAKSFSSNTVQKRDVRGLLDYVVAPFKNALKQDKQLIDFGSKFFWITKPFERKELLNKIDAIFKCIPYDEMQAPFQEECLVG